MECRAIEKLRERWTEDFYRRGLGGVAFITDEGIRLIQTAIAAYLDMETAKLDALVGKVEAAVERLREYRTALITAAVTGKIDVRMNANSIKP